MNSKTKLCVDVMRDKYTFDRDVSVLIGIIDRLEEKASRFVDAHKSAELIYPADDNEYKDSFNDLTEYLGTFEGDHEQTS